jgi:halimadienyl-diphosphate synthase
MVVSLGYVRERAFLQTEIDKLIQAIGGGRTDGTAYDTAWSARLASRYPGLGFEASVEWLRRHQHEDGTWGANLLHHHDRFISTLAAIVALAEVGDQPRDRRRIQRGENALWQYVGRLGRDDSDTIGFPALSAGLAQEAAALGLDVPMPPSRYADKYNQRVHHFLNNPQRPWRDTLLIFSFDALHMAYRQGDEVLDGNNSVGISPSATAALLLHHYEPKAMTYLRQITAAEGTGATPHVLPIDTFEAAWTINLLKSVGAITPDNPGIQRALATLAGAWSPVHGVSFSSYRLVSDVDDTAAAFSALRWGGFDVSADVFAHFEMDDHFACHIGETNPSLSAMVRLLSVVRHCYEHPKHDLWVKKLVSALYQHDGNGSFWWDKWHASPYYVNSTALSALHGIDDRLAYSRFKWILRTQRADGGWGYYDVSTPEETAYCLLGLLYWDEYVERVEAFVLDSAVEFLMKRVNDERYEPLWIGKCLYTPHYPVRAAILSALFGYFNRS